MGRILRTGIDAVVNYTFEETSAYDSTDPAGTTGAWADSAAMDQDLRQTSPSEVTAEGCLVTFQRFPDYFYGAVVKIQPTYDFDSGEVPALELWTHDSTTNAWTLRRSIDLFNLFVGVASGAAKVFDLTFFPALTNVDQVWITMNPGAVGTPTMDFRTIQLYGQCEAASPRGSSRGYDPCANPADPFYTGFDDDDNPCPGTIFGPPTDTGIPDLDLCNPQSIATYREAVSTIPGFVEMFDAWLDVNAEDIAAYCAGTLPEPPVDQPEPPGIPPLPPLDLCDDDSIDAFRAAVSGNAAQLAQFETFIDTLEADGFFTLACPDPLPSEQYIDPETLDPAEEPIGPLLPFGQGPGGVPVPGEDRPEDSLPPKHIDNENTPQEFIVFLFNSAITYGGDSQQDYFAANQSLYSQEIRDAWENRDIVITEGSWATFSRLARFGFSGAVTNAVVGVRVHELDQLGASSVIFSGGTQSDCAVNDTSGTFGVEAPTASDPFYVIRRTSASTTVNLDLGQQATNPSIMPGSSLSRFLCVIIRATPAVAGIINVNADIVSA